MCGKTHSLRICASCSGQLPSYLAEPIICYNRLGATRIHRWMQPKETSQVIPRWWWWWVVVVVALVLYQCLNQSILLLDQLSEFRWERKSIVASRRHLLGLEKVRKQSRMRSRGKHYLYAHETNTNIHSINQTRAYNRSRTIVTKMLGLYYIHGGILLLIWWSTRKIDQSKTP